MRPPRSVLVSLCFDMISWLVSSQAFEKVRSGYQISHHSSPSILQYNG